LSKQSTKESEITSRSFVADDTICLSPDLEDEGYKADDGACLAEDDDSDSDEGLTMTTRKRSKVLPVSKMPRRGTAGSAGSTETAKKVVMDS
jgi:hypothetical protein